MRSGAIRVLDERGLFESACPRGVPVGALLADGLASARHFGRCSLTSIPTRSLRFGDSTSRACWPTADIIRNRAKIEATLANARAAVATRAAGEALDALIRDHAPERRDPPASWADVPSTTPETVALARELKRRGFRFVGPTTLYALMQACGLVDDHLAGCPSRPAVERARKAAGLT